VSIEVLQVQGFACLQGGPRFGWQKFGVPVGGAFDLGALVLANRRVGNPPEACNIELAQASILLTARKDGVLAVSGAVLRVNQQDLPPMRPVWLHAGDVVEIATASNRVYGYAAIQGGWINPHRLTRQIRTSEILDWGPSQGGLPETFPEPAPGPSIFQASLGPQAHFIDSDRLFDLEFMISPVFDRRGIRLKGEPIPGCQEMTSEPCCPGAVQLTPDGQLIVIGPDGPTISGYPKVLVCPRPEVSRLCQLRPGEKLKFTR